MSNIDVVMNEIQNHRNLHKVFSYEDNKEKMYKDLEDLRFIAEIDHDTVYIEMVKALESKVTTSLYLPGDDELEKMYIDKSFPPSFSEYTILSMICIKYEIGLEIPTVTYISTRNGILLRSPKENFAEAWEKYSNRYNHINDQPEDSISSESKNHIHLFFAEDDHDEIWKKLKTIFKFSKNGKIDSFPAFKNKIYYDLSKYWGDPLDLVQDEYEMTAPYEVWELPGRFQYTSISRHENFVIGQKFIVNGNNSIIIGRVDYKSIKYDGQQGFVTSCSSMKELKNHLCSIFKTLYTRGFIDSQIKFLWKQSFNNLWPIGSDIEPKYLIKMCVFKGYYIVECEIWEHGLVYKLTNFKIGKNTDGGYLINAVDNNIRISYHDSDSSVLFTEYVEPGIINEPTGYPHENVLDGWYRIENGNWIKWNFHADTVTQDIDLYSKDKYLKFKFYTDDTLTATDQGSITPTKTNSTTVLSYSVDYGSSWNVWTSGAINSNGNAVYFKATGTGLYQNSGLPGNNPWVLSNWCEITGDFSCMFTSTPNYAAFSRMFMGSDKLVSARFRAPEVLSDLCFYSMFENCIFLRYSPELPADIMKEDCYNRMFYGCSRLVEMPELLSTSLANWCYMDMFSGCVALAVPVRLPADNANYESCYAGMFANSGITSIVIDATVLGNLTMQNILTNSTVNSILVKFTNWTSATNNWVLGVNPSGEFTCQSALPDIRDGSHIPVGWNRIEI